MADKMTQADFDIYIATFAASLDRENSLLRTENAALTLALAESQKALKEVARLTLVSKAREEALSEGIRRLEKSAESIVKECYMYRTVDNRLGVVILAHDVLVNELKTTLLPTAANAPGHVADEEKEIVPCPAGDHRQIDALCRECGGMFLPPRPSDFHEVELKEGSLSEGNP